MLRISDMKSFRWLVILISVWYMAGLLIYAIPDSAKDPPSVWLRDHVAPRYRPYFLLASQWQKWNLFSPDPLNRIMFYHLDQFTAAGWQEIPAFTLPKPGPFKHVDLFKILNQLDGDLTGERPVYEAFLQTYCQDYGVPPGTRLQLRRQYYDIPRRIYSWDEWQNMHLPLQDLDPIITLCPSVHP